MLVDKAAWVRAHGFCTSPCVTLPNLMARAFRLPQSGSFLRPRSPIGATDADDGRAAEFSAALRETPHADPTGRCCWWRAGVPVLIAAIFWTDITAPPGFVVPMFYVLPTLLFMWGGRWWEPAVVAAVATALTVAGVHINSPAGIPAIAAVNRSLEIAGIWLASAVVTLHRILVVRSQRQTARERIDRQAAERRLRGQAALTQLGQLAAVVAHEVRNPLAGVRGSLQVLKSRFPASAQEPAVIDTMIERIDALNAKVTDLLIYSRPAAPRIQEVDLRTLIADADASARAATGRTGPSTVIFGDATVACADPEMLRPALLNLLMNAYQADATGRVEISVTSEDRTAVVSIMDRGPGIPPELRERVFEPFFTTKAGGTGLGLPVVSRLVELQDGTLTLRDRAGGGTIAAVTLPRSR
jgi:signal transduction histidine kinase